MTNRTKKFLVGLILAATMLPVSSFAVSEADLYAQIQSLLAQISSLQSQLAVLRAARAPEPSCATLTGDLKIGATGAQVKLLQDILVSEGYSPESDGTFGRNTASAVAGFQEEHGKDILAPNGLSRGTGYVGKSTRAKLNALWCSKSVVDLLSPKGGETYKIGDTIPVQWSAKNLAPDAYMVIQLLGKTASESNYTVMTNISQGNRTLNTGAISWQIPQSLPSGSRYAVAISGCTINFAAAASVQCSRRTISGTFSVSPSSSLGAGAPVIITSPNGGEAWLIGTTQRIAFSTRYSFETATIELRKGGALVGTTSPITTGSDGLAVYNWTIPSTMGTGSNYQVCAVKGTDADCSNAQFSVLSSSVAGSSLTPSLTLLSPNGGESLTIGALTTVAWSAPGFGESAQTRIDLIDTRRSLTYTLANTLNTGNYLMALPPTAGNAPITADTLYKFCVYVVGSGGIANYDVSDWFLSIATTTLVGATTTAPTITLTSPNGGEMWTRSTNTVSRVQNITFSSSFLNETVTLQLYKGSIVLGEADTITNNTGAGLYGFYLPPTLEPKDNYKLCVVARTTYKDCSDKVFTIL